MTHPDLKIVRKSFEGCLVNVEPSTPGKLKVSLLSPYESASIVVPEEEIDASELYDWIDGYSDY